jgi:hypothetical protein
MLQLFQKLVLPLFVNNLYDLLPLKVTTKIQERMRYLCSNITDKTTDLLFCNISRTVNNVTSVSLCCMCQMS